MSKETEVKDNIATKPSETPKEQLNTEANYLDNSEEVLMKTVFRTGIEGLEKENLETDTLNEEVSGEEPDKSSDNSEEVVDEHSEKTDEKPEKKAEKPESPAIDLGNFKTVDDLKKSYDHLRSFTDRVQTENTYLQKEMVRVQTVLKELEDKAKKFDEKEFELPKSTLPENIEDMTEEQKEIYVLRNQISKIGNEIKANKENERKLQNELSLKQKETATGANIASLEANFPDVKQYYKEMDKYCTKLGIEPKNVAQNYDALVEIYTTVKSRFNANLEPEKKDKNILDKKKNSPLKGQAPIDRVIPDKDKFVMKILKAQL